MKTNLLTLLILITMTVESKAQQTKSTVILVHGAGHGSWCWGKVIPFMKAKKINTLVIDLPGSSNDIIKLFTHSFADDVQAIKNLATSVKGTVILVGHSSAGVAIAQAAEWLGTDKVEKLVFLDAFMPQNGESVLDLVAKATKSNNAENTTDSPPIMLFTENFKAFQWNPVNVAKRFYHDCKIAEVSVAMANLTWQSSASVGTPAQLTDGIYGRIPKYYILCTKAYELEKSGIAHNVPIQKLYKLPSGHSPFLSMPEKLADIFQEIHDSK
jgi:pimeloyl-ACP methyl ester carboxylesterase